MTSNFSHLSPPDGFDLLARRARHGAVTLHAEAVVRPGMVEPVLLLSEAEAPATRWSPALVAGLAEHAGGAIIFDTRDTGRSTWPDEPYEMADLVADALAVLDAFGVARAHVLGRSMGGQVAQALAVTAPSRVASLMLVSTTPGRRDSLGMPQEWLLEKMSTRLLEGAPATLEGRAEWIVEQMRWFAGPVFGVDQEALVSKARAEVREHWNWPNGHGSAVVNAPDVLEQLRNVSVPCLVVHGTADPVLPPAHAEALADALPACELTWVEGLGHELPDAFVPAMLELAAAHLRRC